MDKQLKSELRRLLTGRTMRDEEGWLVAIPEGKFMIHHGITDRTGYRKIKVKETRIQAAEDNEEAFHAIFNALQDIGMLVNLRSKPSALCARCRFFMTKAVILSVTPEGDGIVLIQAFTGRSFTAGLCCRMAIKKLIKKIDRTKES